MCATCPQPHRARRFGFRPELARHSGGGPLSRDDSLDDSILCSPGSGWGYPAFLELPSGTVADPALAPFLHPASDGSGGKALRLRGAATAME